MRGSTASQQRARLAAELARVKKEQEEKAEKAEKAELERWFSKLGIAEGEEVLGVEDDGGKGSEVQQVAELMQNTTKYFNFAADRMKERGEEVDCTDKNVYEHENELPLTDAKGKVMNDDSPEYAEVEANLCVRAECVKFETQFEKLSCLWDEASFRISKLANQKIRRQVVLLMRDNLTDVLDILGQEETESEEEKD